MTTTDVPPEIGVGSSSETVGVPCPAYKAMAKLWELPDALKDGTEAMRQKKWLPRNLGEKEDQWSRRRDRTVLFGAYEDAIQNVVSKPFSRPPSIENPHPRMERFSTKPDAHGNSIAEFEEQIAEEAIHRGIVHILVEQPAEFVDVTDDDGETRREPATLGQVDELGLNPYQVMISAKDLIAWQSRKLPSGDRRLTQIRFIERRREPDPTDPFCEIEVDYIRVINSDGSWQEWAPASPEFATAAKRWVLKADGRSTYPDGIPIDTIYFNRTGFMTAEPVFKSLAWVNLQHFQRDSALNNVMHVVDSPMLLKKMLDDPIPTGGQQSGATVVGPNSALSTGDPDGDAKYVEHSGSALGSSMAHITKLEERMERYGLRPLQMRADSTATGQVIKDAGTTCDAQQWAQKQKASLTRRYDIGMRWIGEERSEETEVRFFTDFEAIGPMSASDMDHVQKARERGDLRPETFLKEMARRQMMAPDFDPAEEAKAVEAEAEQRVQRELEMAVAMSAPRADDEDDAEDDAA